MLNQLKPTIIEINGMLCIVADSNVSKERAEFLTKLLKLNNYDVLEIKNEDGSITIGVNDILFNPVIDVYKRRLKSFTGRKVTPAYWLQISETESEKKMNYWKK